MTFTVAETISFPNGNEYKNAFFSFRSKCFSDKNAGIRKIRGQMEVRSSNDYYQPLIFTEPWTVQVPEPCETDFIELLYEDYKQNNVLFDGLDRNTCFINN